LHSRRHLQFDFLWNNRKLNDGERTVLGMGTPKERG